MRLDVTALYIFTPAMSRITHSPTKPCYCNAIICELLNDEWLFVPVHFTRVPANVESQYTTACTVADCQNMSCRSFTATMYPRQLRLLLVRSSLEPISNGTLVKQQIKETTNFAINSVRQSTAIKRKASIEAIHQRKQKAGSPTREARPYEGG